MVDIEFDITSGLLVAILTLIAILVFFVLNYQYRKKQDVNNKQYATAKDQEVIATNLKKSNEKIASDLKDDTEQKIDHQTRDLKAYVVSQITDVRKDMTHGFELVDLKLEAVNEAIVNIIQKNSDTALLNAETAKNLQRHQERLEQLFYGTGAHSIPPYMEGKEPTQEEKDEPDTGIYKDPDN
jgi:hypothetical protein